MTEKPRENSTPDAVVTGPIEGAERSDTARLDQPDRAAAPRSAPGAAWREFALALRTAFVRGGWPTITAAACVAFLAILCVAVVLVGALKLQYPGFGSGADPLRILSTIVILGLASLGADIRVDRLELSAIPLGALLACGLAIAWAAAAAVRHRDASTRSARAIEGAKIAVPFALICWIASFAFTISGQNRVAAEPASTLAMALLWGAVFGAIGGMRSAEGRADLIRSAASMLRAKGVAWYASAVGALAALSVTAVLSVAAGLLWVIVALASGAPAGRFDAGDAVAAVIYLVAFGPNVMVAIVAVALGAPIEIGARVSVSGELVGPLRDLSLFDWPGGVPWFAFTLLAIPALAGLAAGFFAHRTAERARSPVIVPIAAAVYAIAIFLLALAAEARLGAGLVESRGFGRVAPNPWLAAVFAFLWCAAAGYGGWRLVPTPSPAKTPQ